jgi:hypothetical protein
MSLDELLVEAGRELDLRSAAHDGAVAKPTPHHDHSHRKAPWLLAGAAMLVVAMVAALLVHRPDDPPAAGSGAGANTDSSTAPAAPKQTTSGPLLGASLDTRIAPLVLVDQPGWAISYLHGTEDLPLGDMWVDRLVVVGDGPRYDSPWFTATARPAQNFDLTQMGTVVDVGGVEGRIDVQQKDPTTGLTGPVVTLVWPLPNDRVAYVSSVRMTSEQVLAMAKTVNFESKVPGIVVPAGFTKLNSAVSDHWLNFEYQYTHGSQSLQLDGSNLGVISLLSNMGVEVRTTRVVNGVEIALQGSAAEGQYRADWMAGGWAHYIMASGFASEAELLATLSHLRLVDGPTFAAQAAPLKPLLPLGDRLDLIRQLVDGVSLPANTPTAEWPVSGVATSERDFAFGIYFGLACGWRTTWVGAADAGDKTAQEAAALGADSIAAKAAQFPDKIFADQYTQLAEWMRAGDRGQVSGFGSNDCPTWSTSIG